MKENDYYIKGIKDNNFAVLNDIYENSSKAIVQYVLKNSGNLDDAKDVIQDGLIIIFKKVQEDKLVLSAHFNTYLFSVCRFVWLKKLKKKGNKEVTLDNIEELKDKDDIHRRYELQERDNIYYSAMMSLSDECKKILQLYFERLKGSDIANEMGYTIEYVKRKKYKCKNKLMSIVKSNPLFKEL